MKRAYQPSDRDCKRSKTPEQQPGLFFNGKRYTLWGGASQPFVGKHYYLPVLEEKDVDPEQLEYGKSRLYLYALNPEELATPCGIRNDLYATVCRCESPVDKSSTVKELNLVLAFHSPEYRAHLLNHTLCSLLQQVRDSLPTDYAARYFPSFLKNARKIFAASLLKTYPEVDFHAPVWSHADKKLTTPNQVYLEVLKEIKAAEPQVLELWKEQEKEAEEKRALFRRKGRNKVVTNFVQPALDCIAKWRTLSNYNTCNATGVCLRRRKVPRLIVDLILKRISQQ